MKDCAKVKRALSRFLDKEVLAFEAKKIEEHLFVCPACQKEFLELSVAKQMVTSRVRKTLPQDYLISRLHRGLAQRRRLEAGFSFDLVGRLCRRLIPVPVCVVALSFLFLVLTSGRAGTVASLEDYILNGNAVTSEMALALMVEAAE